MASLAIPLISAGISGLAGLFGGRSQKTTASGTQDTTQTSTPNYTPEQQQFIDQILKQYQGQISGTDLSGYQAQGLAGINQTGNASDQAIRNILAQRGLSFSPAAATSLTQSRLNQGQQQSTFLNNLPLLQYQLKSQALAGGSQFLSGLKIGQTQTGHTSSQETQTGPGNIAGGLFAGIGSGIASTLGRQFANQGSSGGGGGNWGNNSSGWGG
jgi:hypothetical protein